MNIVHQNVRVLPSIVLFDGDVLLYKAAFMAQAGGELKPLKYATIILKSIIQGTCHALSCKSMKVFISPSKNFRHEVDAEYKANRKDAVKPVHFNNLKEFMINKYKAIQCEGIETDDMLGILHTEYGDDVVSASVDKDLLQYPGWHYNLTTKNLVYSKDPGELHLEQGKTNKLWGTGRLWFWAQMLMGDRVDNIPGVKGCGPVKVYNLLNGLNLSQAEYTVKSLYQKHSTTERYKQNKQLLYILREPLNANQIS